MAEETKTDNAEASSKAKKKVPLRLLGILAGVLLLEAGAISTAFLLAGGPSEVKADPAAAQAAAMAEQPVETLVVADKFQNSRTGRAYLYDTEIYIVTKQKYQDPVKEKLDARHAQIRADVATIFRRAEPANLHEPELSTLTRQITAALDKNFGKAPDGSSMLEEVLIGKLTEFPPM